MLHGADNNFVWQNDTEGIQGPGRRVVGISFTVSFHLEIFIFLALKEDTQEERSLFISGLEDPQERGTCNL